LEIYISQGSVATCGVVVYLVTTLLPVFYRMCRWKNFANRSIFGEDMDKSVWLTFWGHPVYISSNTFHWRKCCIIL